MGIDETGDDESFLTPISASSEFSYGPCVVSCRTAVPPGVMSIRNWQPTSAPACGHCGNWGVAATLAVKPSGVLQLVGVPPVKSIVPLWLPAAA